MDFENPERTFSNYVTWMESLRCSFSTTLEPADLVNCKTFAEVLHRIDEKFFPETWVEKIIDYDAESNWRTKANNLSKLLRRVTEYLSEHGGRSIKDNKEWKIDDQQFVELHDYGDLNKVLCLIIGCAFMGRNQEEFVASITQQHEDLQKHVMMCIKYIQTNSSEPEPVSPNLPEHLDTSLSHNGNGDLSTTAYYKEIEELKLENERLQAELENTKQKLLDNNSNKLAEQLETENIDLRKKKDELEDRIIDMDARVDNLNHQIEAKNEELDSLRSKLDQIHDFELEFRNMKDEISELRIKEQDLNRVNRELEAMKLKNKDAVLEKTELKVLRETSAKYLEDSISLEDEQIKNKQLRQQLANLRAEKDAKDGENDRLVIRVSKLEAELGETKAKLAMAEKKNDDLKHEKLDLHDKIRQLESEHARESLSAVNTLGSELESGGDFADRTRLRELESEVTRLRETAKEFDDLQVEKREWQTTKGKNRELESELQITKTKIEEYKVTIEALESRLENPLPSEDSKKHRLDREQQNIEMRTLKEKINLLEKKAMDAEDDKRRANETIAKLESEKVDYENQIKKSWQLLKDQEIAINSSKDGGPSMHQVDLMKKELEYKDKLVKQLQEQIEKINTSHEEELRLTTTSYHEMSQKLDEKSRLSEKPRSFLSKQWTTASLLLPWSLTALQFVVIFTFSMPFWLRNLPRPPPQYI